MKQYTTQIAGLLIYLCVVLAPALCLSAIDAQASSSGWLEYGIKLTGEITFAIVAVQFVLSAQLPWIQKTFGSKPVFTLHKIAAVAAAVLASVHVSLLVLGRGWNVLIGLRVAWPVFLGRIGFVAMIAILAFSFFRKRIPIHNADWRWFHGALAWTILGSGFIHGFLIGGYFDRANWGVVWMVYLFMAVSAWCWARFFERSRQPLT